jgi:hypothetical protein
MKESEGTVGFENVVSQPSYRPGAHRLVAGPDDGTLTGGSGGTACFYRVGLQLSPAPPRLRINRGLAGQTLLQFEWMAGKSNVIEYTSNLRNGVWTAVPSPLFTFPGPGLCQWIDDGTLTGGLGGTARFYRVRE